MVTVEGKELVNTGKWNSAKAIKKPSLRLQSVHLQAQVLLTASTVERDNKVCNSAGVSHPT